MTDKERLEEIKRKTTGEDYLWLIEQAEKNITCQEVLDLQKDALKGLLKQNKRYREALNNIITLWIASTDATDDTWLAHEMSETARKALEEEAE